MWHGEHCPGRGTVTSAFPSNIACSQIEVRETRPFAVLSWEGSLMLTPRHDIPRLTRMAFEVSGVLPPSVRWRLSASPACLSLRKYIAFSLPLFINWSGIKPLNAELIPNCHLLALLGAHHILHVSRIRVKGYRLEGKYNISRERHR